MKTLDWVTAVWYVAVVEAYVVKEIILKAYSIDYLFLTGF